MGQKIQEKKDKRRIDVEVKVFLELKREKGISKRETKSKRTEVGLNRQVSDK